MLELARYPTARLWIQYMEMVDVLRRFIRAERTGNWDLHLQTLRDMLPFYAAAGHNLYAKSVYLYLQQMLRLNTDHPDVLEFFKKGFHVVRRSDRYWAGLSSDLAIEQVLMRSLKTTGGLTRGRGMGETQRTQWLLSMPACASINSAMQEFTDTKYASSDQHKDITTSRKAKDDSDIHALLGFLQERNPFDGDRQMRNIATGVTADTIVNADKAKEVGEGILLSMVGKNAVEYTFKKKNQLITMGVKKSVKVDGETIEIDPQLLFQRLTSVARSLTDNMADVFKFELCTQPLSLFEPNGLLREANKPQLADEVWNICSGAEERIPDIVTTSYVIDGGSLLQRISWTRNETFDAISSKYVDYVKRKYSDAIVVFDGYGGGPSAKDTAHLRRSRGVVGPQVNFTPAMPLRVKKERFLSNTDNKQRFIYFLASKLEQQSFRVIHSEGDADLLIAQTAVDSASKCSTTVIGEDTDLLVLLCYHVHEQSMPLIFRSEGQLAASKNRVWHINHLTSQLGKEMCYLLPFAHALSGCDTTLRLYGIGKGVTLRKMRRDPTLREVAKIFTGGSTKEEIVAAGEKALCYLYGGRPEESLDSLRYRRFCEKVATNNTSVQVQSLPPTSAAARFHSTRVYYQVQVWIGKGNKVNPEDWGWRKVEDRLEAETTELPPAPKNLLKMVRCSCKRGCESRKCSCRKFGLSCSVACGECKGITCSNSHLTPTSDDSDEEL